MGAMSTVRKALGMTPAAPATRHDEIAARWVEIMKSYNTLETDPERDALRWRQGEAAMASGDELAMLELIVLDGNLPHPLYTALTDRLRSGPVVEWDDATELALLRLRAAEPVKYTITTYEGAHYRYPVEKEMQIPVARTAHYVLVLHDRYDHFRAVAVENAAIAAAGETKLAETMARIVADLRRGTTWAALLRDDPLAVDWLHTEGFARYIARQHYAVSVPVARMRVIAAVDQERAQETATPTPATRTGRRTIGA